MDSALTLPSTALVGLSVYDLDTGANGQCVEQIVMPRYEYYVTPLRAASGNVTISSVNVVRDEGIFTATDSIESTFTSTH